MTRLGLFAGVLLSGCVVGPEPVAPALPVPEHYSAAPAPAVTGGDAATPWWQGYEDPALDPLVTQALAESRDLAAAAARVAAAEALWTASRVRGGPALGAQAQGNASRSLERSGADNDDDAGFDDGDFGGGGNAGTRIGAGVSAVFSWSPDLFGGRHRAVQAAQAELRRQDALRQDLARLTAREVVRGYVELRRAAAQQALLAEAVAAQAQTLELLQLRRRAGLVTDADVLRAESASASSRAQQAAATAAQARARHALAIFRVRWTPEDLPAAAAPDALPRYRLPLAPGAPRELLRRRPDLAAAEANLLRATAEIGVATAQLYPSLSLPGSLGARVTGLGAGELARSVVAELSALLQLPLLDGGLRRAEVRAAEARAGEALAAYEHSLLLALQEAEDALADIRAGERAVAEAAQAARAGEQAWRLTEQRYRAGLVGLIDVLDTQRSWLTARATEIDAQADLATAIARWHSATGAPLAPGTAAPTDSDAAARAGGGPR